MSSRSHLAPSPPPPLPPSILDSASRCCLVVNFRRGQTTRQRSRRPTTTVAPERALARKRQRAKERERAHTSERQNGGKTWHRHKTCHVWRSDARRESQGRDTGLLLDRNDSGLMRVTVIVTRFPAGFLNVSSTCSNHTCTRRRTFENAHTHTL